jgi:hypothetical protein
MKHSLKFIIKGCLIEAIILTSFKAFYFSASFKLFNYTFFRAYILESLILFTL